MSEQPTNRFVVKVEEGGGHGGLYELEQTTFYRVIDTRTQEVVLTFEGEMSASLSTSNGQWDDYQYSGVCEVTIASDEQSVRVKYYSGREETVPLPAKRLDSAAVRRAWSARSKQPKHDRRKRS